MAKQEISTRDKIRDIAHDLFAKKGFDAVSVRDISKAADVNVSAINYHFENKLGLFKSVMQESIESIVEDLEGLFVSNPQISTIDYIDMMYSFLVKNQLRLLSSFKFFMSMSDVLKDIEVNCLEGDKPPGGKILEVLIKQEYPQVKDADLAWVIRSIGGLTFHKSIIASNIKFLEQKKKFGITQELLRADLIRSSKVLLNSLL